MGDIPEDANEHCPGPASEEAGKSNSCDGCPNQSTCAAGVKVGPDPDFDAICNRMAYINHKILVLSGKGGVGKSAVAANLARALARDFGKQIGLLDLDICGPSQARMMDVEGECVHESGDGWCPIAVEENLVVMSIALLLPNRNDAVIWRGARKNALIKQFIKDVDWGKLHFLIIDTPPGTSDEHISAVQLLQQAGSLDGAIVVTTPQEVSLLDVRKEISFCHKTKVKVFGVVENMCGYQCPHCAHQSPLFPSTSGGASAMCAELSIPLLAQLPFDPLIAECADNGENYITKYPKNTPAKQYIELADALSALCAASLTENTMSE